MTASFVLIGDGEAAQRHRKAIKAIGGAIHAVYDPIKHPAEPLEKVLERHADFVVVCSPSDQHRRHVAMAIERGRRVICEKPLHLPWEDTIVGGYVRVVLQYRWAHEIPDRARRVECRMVRTPDYFKSWKGDPLRTGGLFYNLFIHYIDIAVRTGAVFHGEVMDGSESLPPVRMVDSLDLHTLDPVELYIRMYRDITERDGGVRPEELRFLHWLLERQSWIHGFGARALNSKIVINPHLS